MNSTAPHTSAQISIHINGEPRRVPAGQSIATLVGTLGLDPAKVAVERNLEIVPRSDATARPVVVHDGDRLEIVHFIGGGDAKPRPRTAGPWPAGTFRSRLIVGTGKYKDLRRTRARWKPRAPRSSRSPCAGST
jgi:thiazole synthase